MSHSLPPIPLIILKFRWLIPSMIVFQNRMSSCRSFGSDFQRYSQPHKVSIGVVVEPPEAGPTKEANVAVQARNGNSVGENNNGAGTTAVLENVSRTERQVDCQWGSLNKGSPLNPKRKQTVQDIDGFCCKLDGVNSTLKQSSRQQFANHTVVQSDEQNRITEGDIIRKKSGKEADSELAKETSFPAVQEPLAWDEGIQQDEPHRPQDASKESLRMKLLEVLSTVPSPKKLLPNTHYLKGDDIKQANACKSTTLVKPGQKSDTIETDSENPAQGITRPVTRSLTRKKRPTRVSSKLPKNYQYSCDKKYLGKHVFSFEDKWFINQPSGITDCGPMAKRKKSNRENSGTNLMDLSFLVKGMASKTVNKNQQSSAAQKVPSRGKENSLGLQKPDGNHLKPETSVNNKETHHYPEAEDEEQRGQPGTPSSHEKADKKEHIVNQPHKDVAARHTDFNSPLSKIRTIETSSPSSLSLGIEVEPQNRGSAHKQKDFVIEETYEFRGRQIRNTGYSPRSISEESAENTMEPEDLLHSSPEPSTGKTDAENGLSTPEERQYDGIAEDLSVSGEYIDTSLFWGDKVKPVLHQTEQCLKQGVGVDEFSPMMLSPEAHLNTDERFEEALKQNQQDGLARAAAVFGLALRKVKNKMISVTNKRCLDILASSAEEIHSHMQHVESQIHVDIEKLTSISKTKRKHLESRLQEQQAQLKYLHEKFLEETNRYLQQCRSTMVELELEQIKLKGAVEKQKASYQKLLSQAEETVETQLIDTQRRITSVQQLGRQKMLQLRTAIAESLKDGLFT